MRRDTPGETGELSRRLVAGVTLLIIVSGSICSMTDPPSALELVVTFSNR